MKKILAYFGFPVMQFLVVGSANAASLGSILGSATSDLSTAGQFGMLIAAITGLCFVIAGLIAIAKGNRGGDGLGKGLLMCLIGVGLISIPAVILATSGTFTNSGASTGLSKLGIGG